MSFAVTIEQIKTVEPHPNADRLSIATLEGMGYTFVIGLDQFKPGDRVIYFPLDAVLPDDVIEKIGLTGRLSGAKKNRVKTVKLRKQISQGIVADPSLFFDEPSIKSADVTEALGIEKYEPPVQSSRNGNLHPLPPFVGKYDLENAQKYSHLADFLMGQLVYITEKLEGSHWGVTYYPETDEFFVLQRNFHIEEREGGEHNWWAVAREGEFKEKLKRITEATPKYNGQPIKAITVRGEIVGPGIQKNYYQLKRHEVYVFEIEINGQPINPYMFQSLCEFNAIVTVPEVFTGGTLKDWLQGRPLTEASNGKSLLVDRKREGVVIKPVEEQQVSEIGRLVLKQRSPEYLLKADC